MEHPSYRGQWSKIPLESAFRHIIVDTDGRQRAPLAKDFYFKNRGSATRWLNARIHAYDHRRRDGRDDPRTWVVKPVKEGTE